MDSYKPKSFTLIELLVVLALIAILAVILILALQPQKIFQKARDSQRISDLKKLNDLITYASYVKDASYVNQIGNPNTVYLSLPDSSSTCGSYTNELPSLPPDWQYHCSATPTSLTNGWIPFDFSSFSNLSQLPVDPINQPPYYYTYVTGGSYKLAAKPENNYSFAASDGGIDSVLYEIGNDLKLPTFQSGLVLYLPFDEGTGTIAYDYSGYGNHGTLLDASSTNSDGNTPPQWTQGKISGALEFDGVDDYVEVPDSSILDLTDEITIITLVKHTSNTFKSWEAIITKGDSAYRLHFKNSNKNFSFDWNDVTGFHILDSGVYPAPGVWFYVAGKLTAGDYAYVYVNGELKNKLSSPLSIQTNITNLAIGENLEKRGRYLYGVVDEVRIYNRALSDKEIKVIYETMK